MPRRAVVPSLDHFMDERSRRTELLRLQRLLLPGELPAIACTEAAAAYRAHNDDFRVGGDWFDLIDRAESQSVVAIVGDVVGHGIDQVSVMGQLRAASNALAHAVDGPDEILAGLDRFASPISTARFASVAVAVFDGTPTARICCAGIPPPIRVDTNGGVSLVDAGRRPPLTFPTGERVAGSFPAGIGDVVVLYTDGVVERRDVDLNESMRSLGDFVGERSTEPCHAIADAIVDEFGADAEDDQAVLVIRPLHQRGDDYALSRPEVSHATWEPPTA
ncbi:MAG: PP2C family protein-serine/threonine phosphatase [Actinomycetota bacterium]